MGQLFLPLSHGINWPFNKKVAKFNDFTSNFQLSLSFHQIVSNQKYVDLTTELSDEFEHLKKDLSDILDQKRKFVTHFSLIRLIFWFKCRTYI